MDGPTSVVESNGEENVGYKDDPDPRGKEDPPRDNICSEQMKDGHYGDYGSAKRARERHDCVLKPEEHERAEEDEPQVDDDECEWDGPVVVIIGLEDPCRNGGQEQEDGVVDGERRERRSKVWSAEVVIE